MIYFRTAGLILFSILILDCGTSVSIPAQFWSLNESEKDYYFGLLAIDSALARKYLNLEDHRDRQRLLTEYGTGGKLDLDNFRERIHQAKKNFGKNGIINDDRAKLWIRYGPPGERVIVEGKRRRISANAVLEIRPVEVWTYRNMSKEFDLVRTAGGNYKLVATTRFGDSAEVAWLEDSEDLKIINGSLKPVASPSVEVSIGRFRQKKGMTRVEFYLGVELPDTAATLLIKEINIYDEHRVRVDSIYSRLVPRGAKSGFFVDQINVLLIPRVYDVEIALTALPGGERMVKKLKIDLLEYADDRKMVSDLVKASLIDDGWTAVKFAKPSKTRLIPLPLRATSVAQPIFFYHEVYNLGLNEEGNHRIKTKYRIVEKISKKEQLVDFVEKIEEDIGTTAYVAVKYHPMNLPPGQYLVVAETQDLILGQTFYSMLEFALKD